MSGYRWDVFISHATEDKDDFVRPLAQELARRGLQVWFDEHTLRIGDSLHKKIAEGVAASRFGIVVLSPRFFEKEWPQRELLELSELEVDGRKVILPVWHGVDYKDVQRFSPRLADWLAGSSEKGLAAIVDMILAAITPDSSTPTWASADGAGSAVRAASGATPFYLGESWACREGTRNTFMVRFDLSSAFGSTRIFEPPEEFQNSVWSHSALWRVRVTPVQGSELSNKKVGIIRSRDEFSREGDTVLATYHHAADGSEEWRAIEEWQTAGSASQIMTARVVLLAWYQDGLGRTFYDDNNGRGYRLSWQPILR